MLDTLMRVGAHRIEYFESRFPGNPQAFGFYIRGEKDPRDVFSRDAKYQLYSGLMLIHSKGQMQNLAGIYVDVDALDNLKRPAYLQFKQDLLSGLFRRVFVLDESALLGQAAAEADLMALFLESGGFEFMVCKNDDCVAIDLPARIMDNNYG